MEQTVSETYINRCERCNRKLSDPAARYGWRCAEILGVTKSLNYAGDETYRSYMQAIKEADAFLRENHIDARTVNLPKFYEAYAKQYLAEGMNDETLLRLTRKDALEALLPKRDRHGRIVFAHPQSPNLPLILDARDQIDYQNGRFATTAFTDNLYDSHIYLLQKKLNEQGATDKFGNRLKEDGVFGPKTQWAIDVGQRWGDVGKGVVSNLKYTQYGLYHVGGDTVFGIIDRTLGRVKNGKPVGVPIIRIDGTDDVAPHINFNYGLYPNLEPRNHTPISNGVFKLAKSGNKITRIAKTGGKALAVAGVVLDAYELGSTIYVDLNDEDKKLGKKTLKTSVGIGGSWVGGLAGAKLGAMGGSAIGTFFCPGLGTAIGGIIGGVGGGITGALGARALGEHIVDKTYKGE
ncbi:MAG: hypothetical protein VB051_00225 [Candidatus Pelethousia sp.]|nr:hypothetical protein [Candidatus Pelethousia sp.]